MMTTSLPLNASCIVGRVSRRAFIRQLPSLSFGAFAATSSSAVPAMEALRATAAGSNGAAAPLELQVLPNPVWVERIHERNRLSFDLGIRSHDNSEWELSFIGLRIYDGSKTIYLNGLDLGGGAVGSIQTLGETHVPPGGYLFLFNPFPPLDPRMPLQHLRCSLFLTAGSRSVTLAADIHPMVYRQKNRFRVPLQGRLFLSNGHDYYSSHRRRDLYRPILRQLGFPMTNSNRYAQDFMLVDEMGAAFRGGSANSRDYFGFGRLPFPTPVRNEDYFGFGAPILALGEGRIVAPRRDLQDNLPLQYLGFPPDMEKADRMLSWGNYIIIDHGYGEYFVLAHCQQGSVTVKRDDTVKRGQGIARIGSSGAAAYPHLHCHLVNGPDPTLAEGMPVNFSDFNLVLGSGTVRVSNDCPDTGDFLIA